MPQIDLKPDEYRVKPERPLLSRSSSKFQWLFIAIPRFVVMRLLYALGLDKNVYSDAREWWVMSAFGVWAGAWLYPYLMTFHETHNHILAVIGLLPGGLYWLKKALFD